MQRISSSAVPADIKVLDSAVINYFYLNACLPGSFIFLLIIIISIPTREYIIC